MAFPASRGREREPRKEITVSLEEPGEGKVAQKEYRVCTSFIEA
jgi:hypothetical protein